MDWNAVATALEAEGEACGINTLDYVPESLPNTGMYVGEMDIEPNQSFNSKKPDGSRKGTDAASITLRLLVARSDDKHAIRKMRSFLAGSGAKSLVERLQETNGRIADYPWSGLKVTAMRGNRLFVVGETKYYGTEIEIYVTGPA